MPIPIVDEYKDLVLKNEIKFGKVRMPVTKIDIIFLLPKYSRATCKL